MCSTSEYCQRKDIHIHLVLVHHFVVHAVRIVDLSVSYIAFFLNKYSKSLKLILFSLSLSYSILIISMTSVRTKILAARNRLIPYEMARKLSQKLDIGDWWLIYMLSRNLDPIVYKDVMAQLLERLEMRNNHQNDEKS